MIKVIKEKVYFYENNLKREVYVIIYIIRDKSLK